MSVLQKRLDQINYNVLSLINVAIFSKFKGKIWEYGPGSYFIQVSECEWVQFSKNLFWAKFNYDGSAQSPEKVLYLSTRNYELDIFENKFNLYKLKSGKDRKLSDTQKGQWKNLTAHCQDYKSGILIPPPIFKITL